MESASTSTLKEGRLSNLICTAQRVLYNRAAKDVISHGFLQLVASDTVDSSTQSIITAASHLALPGNLIRFTSGTLAGYSVSVIDIDTNTITLGADLPSAPSASDAFDILAYRHPLLDSNGALSIAIDGGTGWTPGKRISVGTSVDSYLIKNSSGRLGMLTCSNINDQECFLKVYDKATAPTVGSDTPKFTFVVPGNTRGSGTNIPIPLPGIAFSLGIGIGISTLAADNDTTAVTAGEVIINYAYK